MTEIKQTIKKALSEDPQKIALEEIPTEETSPLNQPVVERDFTLQAQENQAYGEFEPDSSEVGQRDNDKQPDSPLDLDAPEQEIDEDFATEAMQEEAFEIPSSHARQAADAFLGIADNILEIGGGFFVKIRKVKSFYDFEEVIQVVDQQNERNVRRIKLDKEDKILLQPLLIAIIKKRAQKLSVEQQFMGALLSVLMKKVQMVVEVRAENEILVERIIEIIKKEQQAEEKSNESQQEDSNAASSKEESDLQIDSDAIIEVAEDISEE